MKNLTVLFVVLMLLLSVTPTLANTADTTTSYNGNSAYSYVNSDINGFYITFATSNSYYTSGPGYTVQHQL